MRLAAVLLALAALSGPARGAATPAASSTTGVESVVAKLPQVSSGTVKVAVSPTMTLSLPDGDNKLIVENNVADRSLKLGTQYNYIFGKIRYWASYGMPVYKKAISLDAVISDDIGFGRIYNNSKFLERARTGLTRMRFFAGGAAVFLGLERTDWHLSPFVDPNLEDKGLIDAVSIEAVPSIDSNLIPEAVSPDQTRILYRRGFRGLGGKWHFDKIEGDISWNIPAFRDIDTDVFHIMMGQAMNVVPELPLRETFALGGISALKGYGYEEYRGTGVMLGGLEYGWRLPFVIETTHWQAGLTKNHFLLFGEIGRTEYEWHNLQARYFKRSVGAGLRFQGHWGDRGLHFRVYGAQALEAGRTPLWYAMMDLK